MANPSPLDNNTLAFLSQVASAPGEFAGNSFERPEDGEHLHFLTGITAKIGDFRFKRNKGDKESEKTPALNIRFRFVRHEDPAVIAGERPTPLVWFSNAFSVLPPSGPVWNSMPENSQKRLSIMSGQLCDILTKIVNYKVTSKNLTTAINDAEARINAAKDSSGEGGLLVRMRTETSESNGFKNERETLVSIESQ